MFAQHAKQTQAETLRVVREPVIEFLQSIKADSKRTQGVRAIEFYRDRVLEVEASGHFQERRCLHARDTLGGGLAGDVLNGQAGPDFLNGRGGMDIVRGGDHNDTLNGNDQVDFLFGMADPDTLNGGAAADYIVDVAAEDQIRIAESAERYTTLGPIKEDWFETWIELDPLEPPGLPFDLQREVPER